ncbi:hypothetical protein BIW11_13972 [Tropilaelaps mercedesae]|uniref:RNA-dependent RNA polymerase n=1 Tax=Tropilaelaps mercedesae TaxID=418985 RepID=A0A1V9WZL3_9ACAR|nr:hypothetical protein BIW11_13972 [Tropilaelaps mercedesae]
MDENVFEVQVNAPEEMLQVRLTCSSSVPRRVLNESFGCDLVGNVKKEELKNPRLGAPRWLYTCTLGCPYDLESYLHAVDRFCKHFDLHGHVDASTLTDDFGDFIESDHLNLGVEYFAFGLWTDLDIFIRRFSSVPIENSKTKLDRLKANFYHDQGYMEIYFREMLLGASRRTVPVYKLQVRYSDITYIVAQRILRHKDQFYENKREPMDIYLHISTVATFRWDSENMDAYEHCFNGPWKRQESFGTYDSSTCCRDVGENRVLALRLQHKGVNAPEAIYSLFYACNAPIVFAKVKIYDFADKLKPMLNTKLSDEVQYALDCLQSVAPELLAQIDINKKRKEIQQLLEKLAGDDEAALVDALYEIYHVAKNNCTIDLKTAIESTFKEIRQTNAGGQRSRLSQASLPSNLCLVKKAVVCPSKVVFEPVTVVQASVLLQQYDPSSVILVDVRDDNFAKLQTETDDEAWELIQKAIAVRIKKGLKVGRKKYFFLGASREQLGEHSFWMYAKSDSKSEDPLIHMGVEGNLAKRLKSLNMLLKEVIAGVPIDESWVTEEDCSLEDKQDFKQGIGRISKDALSFILDKCEFGFVSAIRVVYRGYVGTLVLDTNLQYTQIIFRKSQRVSLCPGDILYVTGVCSKRPAVLDNLLVTTLGSKCEAARTPFDPMVFTTLVSSTLAESASPFCDNPFDLAAKIEQVLVDLPVRRSKAANYDIHTDVLFRQALRCAQLKRLRDLKELKLRMPGAFRLMPVIDEYDILDEGKIYMQVTDIDGNIKVVTGGNIVVARIDAMHPSEVRLFEAVSGSATDALRHLTDCIVFSSRGAVSPLSYFSPSGDFAEDSDVIVIVNEKFLFQDSTKNSKYRRQPTVIKQHQSPDQTLVEHYFDCLTYTVANNIGDTFCAFSDLLENQAYSDHSMNMSYLRDQLYLFVSGIGALPRSVPKVAKYPDFLKQNTGKGTYCSSRALGACFRRMKLVDVDGLTNRGCCNLLINDLKTEQNRLLSSLEGSEEFAKDAVKAMRRFKERVKVMEALYGLNTEEILTATIFTVSDMLRRPNRIARMESTILCHLRHLATLTKKQFFCGGMADKSQAERARKMSAYFAQAIKEPQDGGYALPWMLADEMLNLIIYTKLPEPVAGENAAQAFLLSKMMVGDTFSSVSRKIKESVFHLISGWIKKHIELFALARLDECIFLDRVNHMAEVAFENAWRALELAELNSKPHIQKKSLDRIVNQPNTVIQLLASVLRGITELDDESVLRIEKMDRSAFIKISIGALLCNVLLKAAAYGSFDPLLTEENIISNKVVSCTFFLPLSGTATENDYIRTTQGNLQEFQKRLEEFSLCRQVKVQVLPQGDDETGYEKVWATGRWFAVQNLTTIMLMPDFRKLMLGLFRDKYRIDYYGD